MVLGHITSYQDTPHCFSGHQQRRSLRSLDKIKVIFLIQVHSSDLKESTAISIFWWPFLLVFPGHFYLLSRFHHFRLLLLSLVFICRLGMHINAPQRQYIQPFQCFNPEKVFHQVIYFETIHGVHSSLTMSARCRLHSPLEMLPGKLMKRKLIESRSPLSFFENVKNPST